MNLNIQWNKTTWSNEEKWKEEWKDGYAWGTRQNVESDFNRFVKPFLPNGKPAKMLEIACGMGRFTEILLNHCETLHSIDIQEVCVNRCLQRFKDNPKFSASITDGMSLPDKIFTTIVSYDSLVHVDYEILKAYYHQAQERLEPDGYMIIHHANRPDSLSCRFAVTSEMICDLIYSLSKLQMVCQTLFRYTNYHFVDCVSVCKRID